MDDKAFDELKMRMAIVPEQARWPAPDFVHWQRLHAVADEARERVSKAYAQMDEIDRNADLSREGKERQRRKVRLKRLPTSRPRKRWRVRVRSLSLGWPR